MSLPVISNTTINKIISSWKSLQVKNTLFNGDGYIAPTFYLLKGASLPGLNYYDSAEKALEQLYYLTQTAGHKAQTAKDGIAFKKDGTAQTAGINVDIFLPIPLLLNYPLPYSLFKEFVKQTNYPYYILRFYKTNGTGPFYAVINTSYFGIAATVVKATGEKLAAMNEFYGNLDVIKASYNSLVTSLNILSEKPFNPATQETINRLTQQRISMLDAIRQIKNVSILQSTAGTLSGVGIIPLAVIVILAVAGAAAWSVNTWIEENQKSRRIRDSFAHQTLMVAEQDKLLADVKAGKYPADVASAALKNLGIALKTGEVVAKKASEENKSMFGEIGDMVKWAAIGLGVFAIANAIGKNKK